MRSIAIASVGLLTAFGMAGPSLAESPADALTRICKAEDILTHAKKIEITPAYRAQICPCIGTKIQASAKPDQIQAIVDILKVPVAQRKQAMAKSGKAAGLGFRAFLQAQMVCAKQYPPPK